MEISSGTPGRFRWVHLQEVPAVTEGGADDVVGSQSVQPSRRIEEGCLAFAPLIISQERAVETNNPSLVLVQRQPHKKSSDLFNGRHCLRQFCGGGVTKSPSFIPCPYLTCGLSKLLLMRQKPYLHFTFWMELLENLPADLLASDEYTFYIHVIKINL
ncbi:unnamed protein product [Danaus chrysippus]|uniref:(African queen) hypothetical protein n=1 Tax=Danaus chrysippus TaxID=151541 RepID=A0A8J2QMZ1_9NEOP|nr:unnamed protein product [Danaus chrysippus]